MIVEISDDTGCGSIYSLTPWRCASLSEWHRLGQSFVPTQLSRDYETQMEAARHYRSTRGITAPK